MLRSCQYRISGSFPRVQGIRCTPNLLYIFVGKSGVLCEVEKMKVTMEIFENFKWFFLEHTTI